MKILFVILGLLPTTDIFCQDTVAFTSQNEFDYRKSNPGLQYSFEYITKTHNYSNNWDLDNDGIKDQLYFVGTGGAHLYYFLKVILSSEKLPRYFEYIESDFPVFKSSDTSGINKSPFGFIVSTLGNDKTPSIIVKLDNSTFRSYGRMFTKMGIRTPRAKIRFENGKVNFGCL